MNAIQPSGTKNNFYKATKQMASINEAPIISMKLWKIIRVKEKIKKKYFSCVNILYRGVSINELQYHHSY